MVDHPLHPLFFPRMNALMRLVLRSRLHPLASWYVAVLRVQTDVSLLYRGRWRSARAEAIEDQATVADVLASRDWPRRLLMPLTPDDAVAVRVVAEVA